MIEYLFANPDSEKLLPKVNQLLLIGKGYHWKETPHFPSEPYRITVLSSLAKTNAAAQYNYEYFTKTMAKMVQKYGNKIN